MAKNKMDWFVDKYFNEGLDYLIATNNEDKKGTIVAPTGAGKSGLMFEDTVYHIRTENRKCIFHYTSPILKLGWQTANDLFDVLSRLFEDKCKKGEFMLFLNSSADGRDFDAEKLNSDVNNFSKDIDKFINSETAKYAIVVSCFDSTYKFADKIDELNKVAKVVTYIDEAHLFVNQTRDDHDYDALSEDGKKMWTTLEKLCKGEHLYAFTATPDKYVTKIINEANGTEYSHFIINISPNELISKNIILPVRTFTCKVTNDTDAIKLTSDHCIKFMDYVKEYNPNIKHKILVCCANTEHLRYLRDALAKSTKYKIFSTCSKEGGASASEDEFLDIDEVEFINEVDGYNDDCFVLHIRQLTQGIDIKSLTDCIMYNSTRVNDGVKRCIIQTIGRCLRPLSGERGVDKENRLKKEGCALFLVGEKDYDTVLRQMQDFLIRYYGLAGITAFTSDAEGSYGAIGKNKGKFQFGKIGDSYFNNYWEVVIEELRVKMEEYIIRNVKPQFDIFVRLNGGKPTKNLIPMAIAKIKNKFSLYDGEHSITDVISDNEFMTMVSELFEKYGVK